MRQPNTFIIGAPKCGTSALASYLATHPQVYVGNPKEPQFWSKDIDEARTLGINGISDYLRVYSDATDKHSIVVDASTNYLWSNEAVGNILEFDPSAKFIVMLRNPIEVAFAYHMEECFWQHENELDFEKAWELCESRRQGRNVPENCPDAQKLDYERIACLGDQVRKGTQLVPKSQLHIILLEDMKKDSQSIYRRTLDFLEITDDGRDEFPRVNTARQPRNNLFTKLLLHPPKPFRPAVNLCRRFLWSIGVNGIRTKLYSLLNKKCDGRPEISSSFRTKLLQRFNREVAQLERILSRDLQHWT